MESCFFEWDNQKTKKYPAIKKSFQKRPLKGAFQKRCFVPDPICYILIKKNEVLLSLHILFELQNLSISLRRVPNFYLKGLLHIIVLLHLWGLLCLNWTRQAQGKGFQLTHYSSSQSNVQLARNAQLVSRVFIHSFGLCLSHNRETKEIHHPLPLEAVSNVNLR